MAYVAMETLYKKTHSIYKLVILAAKRAVELNEGATKLVTASPSTKLSTISLKEIAEGKISFKNGAAKE
jgi:DNA-directed RNA polymerase omega subunit